MIVYNNNQFHELENTGSRIKNINSRKLKWNWLETEVIIEDKDFTIPWFDQYSISSCTKSNDKNLCTKVEATLFLQKWWRSICARKHITAAAILQKWWRYRCLVFKNRMDIKIEDEIDELGRSFSIKKVLKF